MQTREPKKPLAILEDLFKEIDKLKLIAKENHDLLCDLDICAAKQAEETQRP